MRLVEVFLKHKKLWLGAALSLGVAFSYMYVHNRAYNRGYSVAFERADKERQDALLMAAQEAEDLAVELERIRHEAYISRREAEDAIRDLSADADRMRNTIRSLRSKAEGAGAPAEFDAVAAAAWVALEECVSEYSEMGKVADDYVERLREAQGWAEVVSGGG